MATNGPETRPGGVDEADAASAPETEESEGASGANGSETESGKAAAAAEVPHPAFAPYAAEDVPQAAVGSPGKDGTLELRFEAGAGGTDMVRDYATVPFHVSGTLGHDPHPDAETVFVQSPTGGVAQGDRLDQTVAVEAGAVAHVSTQSSTKVQSMARNYARSQTHLSVGAGGHLDFVPEPTILHADARFAGETTLDLAEGATAIVGEVVVPGRLARGEQFDFERYCSTVEAEGPEGLLLADATHLAPADRDPTAPGVLGEYTVYGTLFVVAPDCDAATLNDALHDAVADSEGRAGATELPNSAGVAVRALGDRAETVQATLHAAWDHARRELIDAPAPSGRKY